MKKGFTLIELLAVILIFGIIALIAIPSVTSVIEESKQNSLKSSATNIVKVAEQNCQLQKMKGEAITKNYTITDSVISSELGIKHLPKNGSITVNDNCEAIVAIIDNNYCVKTDSDNKATISSNLKYCNIVESEVPKTKESCFIFDETTKTITGYDFEDLTCPSEILIPATINSVPVEHIGDYAFADCGINNITWGKLNKLTHIHGFSFKANSLVTLFLPDGVTYLGGGVFMDSIDNIDNITFTMPSSITSLSGKVFYGLSGPNLTTVKIASTMTSIYDTAFACKAQDKCNYTVEIDKPEESLSGAPWGTDGTNNFGANVSWRPTT